MNTLAQDVLSVPLNNAQLELLKILASAPSLTEADWLRVKRTIVQILAERLAVETDRIWDERGYTQEDMDKLLHTNMRTPYRRKQG